MSRVWKDVSLDPDVPINERAKLAVWDFPVSDKYGKVRTEIVEGLSLCSMFIVYPLH